MEVRMRSNATISICLFAFCGGIVALLVLSQLLSFFFANLSIRQAVFGTACLFCVGLPVFLLVLAPFARWIPSISAPVSEYAGLVFAINFGTIFFGGLLLAVCYLGYVLFSFPVPH